MSVGATSGTLKRLAQMLALLMVVGIAADCSSTPPPEDYDDENYSVNDPLEGINRVTFAFNQAVDSVLIKPVAEIYVGLVPRWGRDRVNDALNNLGEPDGE